MGAGKYVTSCDLRIFVDQAAEPVPPRALRVGTIPAEVTTDRAAAYPRVLDELIPSALQTVERYASNLVEADHGRLEARLRPMRGLKTPQVRADPRRRARVRAEPAPRPLRTRRRRPRPPPNPRSLRPARDGHLVSRSSPSARPAM